MNNIKILDNLQIIKKNNKYICKKKSKNDYTSLFKYLESKDFHNFVYTSIIDGYEIRDYIEEIDITNEEKLKELIYVISLLHIKTTHYKNYPLNEIKKFYEKSTEYVLDIKNYYNEIVESNDIYLFLKPSIKLLIDEISIIFVSLDNSKFFLDKWYDIVKEKQRKRVVVNHNNLKISNFIVGSKAYLINYDKSIIDYSIYDIVSLFKNNYKMLDLIDIYNEYCNRYNLYEEELFILYFELLKIDKIVLSNNEIINVREITNLIKYLKTVSKFLEYCMKCNK